VHEVGLEQNRHDWSSAAAWLSLRLQISESRCKTRCFTSIYFMGHVDRSDTAGFFYPWQNFEMSFQRTPRKWFRRKKETRNISEI